MTAAAASAMIDSGGGGGGKAINVFQYLLKGQRMRDRTPITRRPRYGGRLPLTDAWKTSLKSSGAAGGGVGPRAESETAIVFRKSKRDDGPPKRVGKMKFSKTADDG